MVSTQNTKIYFISDFHLGVPDEAESRKRELRIIDWLDTVRKDAAEIYLLGDVFDFWFEYKHVVPKGFVRLLGKLAELSDEGIKLHYFTGNHDMWAFDYLPSEIGVKLYRQPIRREIHGKTFVIGHGDGLGPGDHGYKFIKSVFANKFCQWLFQWIHPNIGVGIANFFSRRSRIATGTTEDKYLGDNKERLVQYCEEQLKIEKTDYFVFGHRHLPIEKELTGGAMYFNIGDWIRYDTYLVVAEDHVRMIRYGI
jgi:UDP-2,3-diacylglucosamine hydrolase